MAHPLPPPLRVRCGPGPTSPAPSLNHHRGAVGSSPLFLDLAHTGLSEPSETCDQYGFRTSLGSFDSQRRERSLDSSQIWTDPKNKKKPQALDCNYVGAVESLSKSNWVKGGLVEKKDVDKGKFRGVECGGLANDEHGCSMEKDEKLAWSGLSDQAGFGVDMPATVLLLQDANEWEMLSLEDDVNKLPSIEVFILSLQKCKNKKYLAEAKSMYTHICSFGLEAQDAVGNHSLPMFVECGSVSHAQQVFNIMGHRSEHSWTSLISGYVQGGKPQHALNLYPVMQDDSVHASSYTLVALLKACALLKDICRGQEIHIQTVQKGLEQVLPVASTLVSMYAACGLISDAQVVFDLLPSRDLVSWTALISGYVEHGFGEQAIDCFEQMKRESVSPDAVTISCIFKACGCVGALDKGRKIHMDISQCSFRRDHFVCNSLVGMYAKCGALLEAREVFDELPLRGVVSWNALIAGYAKHGPGQEALKCFQQMPLRGVSPDAVTFASVLKACGSIGAIDTGKEVHVDCTQKGLEDSPHVGNTLVGMYAKCGSLLEAQKVFESLPCQDVVSWTVLISGYAEHGPFGQALRCFGQMQAVGVSPNATAFACILKACGSVEHIDTGREIHMMVLKMGLETGPSVGNSLVGMYGKSGLIQEAQEVFDKLTGRDAVSWTVLVAGYAEHGSGQEALECFKLMRVEGVSPDPTTFACVLQACGMIGAVEEGQQLHMEIAETELGKNPFIVNSLLSMYAKCGLLVQAREFFDKAPVRDAVSWTTLISGYVEFGPVQEALRCFEQMQLEGIFLDSISFACILKGCGSIGATSKGHEIHMEIVKRGFDTDLAVGNTLVSMYSKCGSLLEAREVFSSLPVLDRVSWNALIAGYSEHGPVEEALRCFELMQVQGISPDAVTFACALKACLSTGDIGKAGELYTEVTIKGLERDVMVGNTLVSFYAIHGSLLEAQEVFDELPLRDMPSWYALIAGYAEHGPGQEALHCFEEMQQEGISPDAATYASALKACSSIGTIDKGREIHMEIAEKGFETDVSVGNSLVSMYAKCGLLPEAQEVFDKLLVRDVAAWSSMIQGYGMKHQGDMALQCYKDMQEEGVKPDAVTFTCLLMACSHSSLVYKGHEYFKVMSDHGITPTVEHYTCMIDLLAKSGHLYEAERFVEMLCPPCEASWAALLSACKIHGEVELGLRCFQHLVRLRLEDAAWYVLLADIYASTGSWLDAYRVEELRKHAGAMKKPGVALIEVNKRVHQFVVGDKKSEEVSAMLDSISSRMKADGHVPNLGLVLKPITDEEKEEVLCEHAEKLAIAFGLLNTPQGQTLRVTKNLRMCIDCHEASKVVSRLEKREIILRDNCCIHHFKDGLCSCGDAF